jgi:transcriptional regulator with XRE-family HTH domain
MKMNVIGINIKKARLLSSPKLTQKDLAARLQLLGWKIDRGGIAKIEVGLRSVTDKEIVLLAEALEVSINYLFYGK